MKKTLNKGLFVLICILMFCTMAESYDPFVGRLMYIVSYAPYEPSEYSRSIFDCSNMSSLMQEWLNRFDYETRLLVFGAKETGQPGHIAVGVKAPNGKWIIIEATRKKLGNPRQYMKKYPTLKRYRDGTSLLVIFCSKYDGEAYRKCISKVMSELEVKKYIDDKKLDFDKEVAAGKHALAGGEIGSNVDKMIGRGQNK